MTNIANSAKLVVLYITVWNYYRIMTMSLAANVKGKSHILDVMSCESLVSCSKTHGFFWKVNKSPLTNLLLKMTNIK